MDNTFQLTGTVYKTIIQDRYSKVILRYLNGSREQHTPFTAYSEFVNEQIKYLAPGKEVTLDFWVGGKESNGKFFANNMITKIN